MSKARELADVIGTQDTTENVLQGRKNLIINGAMQVAQRGTSFNTSGTGSPAYLVDRFLVNDGGCGTSTITQENDGVAGVSEYSLKYAATSNDTNTSSEDCWIRYVVETKDITNLNLKDSTNSLTLSFWVKSSQTGQSSIAVSDGQYSYRYIATYTVLSADTWQKVTVNVPSPSLFNYNGDYGLRVYWDLGAASNYVGTPNVWSTGVDWAVSGNFRIAGVSGEYLQITGVQLEVGSVATPFEHRSFGEELALCQRYCFVLGAAGFSTPTDSAYSRYPMVANSTSTCLWFLTYPATMRSTPSITLDGATTDIDIYNYEAATGNNLSSFNMGEGSIRHGQIGVTISGTHTVGQFVSWRWLDSPDAALVFDAEL